MAASYLIRFRITRAGSWIEAGIVRASTPADARLIATEVWPALAMVADRGNVWGATRILTYRPSELFLQPAEVSSKLHSRIRRHRKENNAPDR